ncbi:MAG: class I SAM-dependent methyltransferase [Rhodovibrionaceae bacterium]
MALDSDLLAAAEALREPGMGTEGVGPLLYSLIRMTRPRAALEVGIGYTSLFIARALADAAAEHAADRALLADPQSRDRRKPLLIPPYYTLPYAPKLYAIDDYSAENATARQTLEVLEAQGLRGLVELHEGDFRGCAAQLPPAARPLDFVWFDCGGPEEYQAFFQEYWPLINPNHGLVALHFSYWSLPMEFQGRRGQAMQPSAILNELKRQQIAAGEDASFEVLSLLEPHKHRQGSVTLLRRLAPTSRQRDKSYAEEMTAAGFDPSGGFPRLG